MQLAVDAIGGDDRHVHQQSQGDDERGDGDLLQGNSQHLHAHERHGDAHGNGGGQDQRRAPIHQEQRHEDHDDHRLHKALHEMLDAMIHGRGLVGQHPKLQPFRRARFHRFHHLLHVLVEMADDFAIAHFDGDHHGPARVQLRSAAFRLLRRGIRVVG